MRQIAKPILLTAGILLGIFITPSLLMNAWLLWPGNSQKLVSMAEAEGLPKFTIKSVHASPFASLTFSGIANSQNATPFLASADSLKVTPLFRDLLRGRLTLGSCLAEKPSLKLTMPPPSTGVIPSPIATSSTPIRDSRSSSPATGNSLVNPLPGGLLASVGSTDHGTKISVKNGEFVLLNPESKVILSLHDVGVLDRGSPLMRITAGNARVGEVLQFNALQGDLSMGSPLALRNLKAGFAGGLLTGAMDCQITLSATSLYHADLRLSGADPAALFSGSRETSDSKGTLSGTLVLEGIPGNGSAMNGHGELVCAESVIRPVDFLQQVGRILNIEELQLLRLSEGRCLFRIQSGNFVIDQLFLRSENLCLTAKGPVASTGELSLEARILLNEKLTRRLGGILGKQLQPAPELGYTQIPFNVSGTLRNPRTDLLERLTGIRIGGDLGGFLQGLFGRPNQKPAP